MLQTTHWLIGQTGIKDWLSDLEIFALLLSAIIHDYDHSGTTNNFHVQSSSNLAILYNDKSVLENHHVAAFFKTMLDNDCFILGNMSQSDFREFRSLMIEMVLHTGEEKDGGEGCIKLLRYVPALLPAETHEEPRADLR